MYDTFDKYHPRIYDDRELSDELLSFEWASWGDFVITIHWAGHSQLTSIA